MKQTATFLALAMTLGFTTSAVSGEVEDNSFYDKKDVRAFFSLKGDYRRMHKQAAEYINDVMFETPWIVYGVDSTGNLSPDVAGLITEVDDYGRFATDGSYPLNLVALHFEVGAQYRDFLTWFDINTIPTQVSSRPAQTSARTGARLYDAKWFIYGADWMFGWMFPSENAPLQLIPAMGGGVGLLNLHFPTAAQTWDETSTEDGMKPYTMGDRYYSSLGKTFVAEMEARMRLPGGLSIGGYAGYRVSRFDQVEIENISETKYLVHGEADQNFDQWYVGGKLTYTLPSANMIRDNERL